MTSSQLRTMSLHLDEPKLSSETIRRQTARFLAKGNKIEEVPFGVIVDKSIQSTKAGVIDS